MTIHHLESSNETLHGTFWSGWEPILTIDPGDTVIVSTLEANGVQAPPPKRDDWSDERFTPTHPGKRGGHALIGPIAVRGALAGQNLVVDIEEIVVGDWGWIAAIPNEANVQLGAAEDPALTTWRIDRQVGRAIGDNGFSVPISPFFGVMGMPDASPDPIPSRPARPNGGNLDCKELIAGSRLYLPIAVDGALFSIGDGHAAQGDGEVAGVALESPIARGVIRLSLDDSFRLTRPLAKTPTSWITFGFDEDLNVATLQALHDMLDLLQRQFGISRSQALVLASVAVDLRITQIVNGVRGVHAILRDDAIRGL